MLRNNTIVRHLYDVAVHDRNGSVRHISAVDLAEADTIARAYAAAGHLVEVQRKETWAQLRVNVLPAPGTPHGTAQITGSPLFASYLGLRIGFRN